MAKSTDDQMIDLLNQILRVQAIQAVGSLSITEGARLLKIAGLDNQTISEVLNTSAATVRTVTTNLWDRPKKRRKGK
jgi:3-hydroxyisobutyrate dehydrogenase-like beta-hydroxyacid dehydrogenase